MPPAPSDLLLHGVHRADGTSVDVWVRSGQITAVEPAGGCADDDPTTRVDLAGYLILPAPVEPHAHLDKAYTADLVPNPNGDLETAVQAWLRVRADLSTDDVVARAEAAALAYVANGATVIRTHVDIGADVGLRGLLALAEVRDRLASDCGLQIVAFASAPLTGAAGAAHRRLLADALSAGADVVGACPAVDPDPAACVETCLALAGSHGVAVDLHVDEHLDAEPDTLSMLADAVLATRFPHAVVASHCVSLGMRDADLAGRIADRAAKAGIAVVCLPQTNLYLQGRAHPAATPRGLTAMRILRAAGVTVAAGGDNLQDPFNCLGRADPLETAALLVLAGHEPPERAYDAVSSSARRAIGLPDVELRPGQPADLLAIRAANVREAIAAASPDRVVLRGGRIVAQTTTVRHRTTKPEGHPGE